MHAKQLVDSENWLHFTLESTGKYKLPRLGYV